MRGPNSTGSRLRPLGGKIFSFFTLDKSPQLGTILIVIIINIRRSKE